MCVIFRGLNGYHSRMSAVLVAAAAASFQHSKIARSNQMLGNCGLLILCNLGSYDCSCSTAVCQKMKRNKFETVSCHHVLSYNYVELTMHHFSYSNFALKNVVCDYKVRMVLRGIY